MRISTDPLLPQVRELGGQLVIADGSGRARPDWADDPAVTWLSLPGAVGYQLRQAAYLAAEAPIIAITEDHCRPAEDWLANVVDAHRRHPAAAAVYGIVDNGSPDHLIDWALYGAGYIAWASPEPAAGGTPPHANLSFKSWIFDRVVAEGDQVMEFRYLAALRRAGYDVVADAGPRVAHTQSTGFAGTSQLVFFDGRAIAGMRRRRMTAADWLRLAAPGPLAVYRTVRTLRIARTKPQLGAIILRSAPLIALLHLIHAMGEGVGYLRGSGNSFERLH
jgi:hypothetical protein